MTQQTDFLYWLELPEGVPVELELLPKLFAAAMHRLRPEQLFAEQEISYELDCQLKSGALKPRSEKTMSPLPFSPARTTAFLWWGSLLPSEVRSLAAQRGIGLRLVAHGVGPDLWTVANIVDSYGPQPCANELYELIVDLVRDGAVPYCHPITRERSVVPFDARTSLLSKNDVDGCMSIGGLPFRVGVVTEPWGLEDGKATQPLTELPPCLLPDLRATAPYEGSLTEVREALRAAPSEPAVDTEKKETPEERALRLRQRVQELKGLGYRDYASRVAKEEGFKTARLRQILSRFSRKETPLAGTAADPFGLAGKRKD